eukprot:SAG11_NODE_7481_length_1138_cov_1.222329_2_plen_110_part_00
MGVHVHVLDPLLRPTRKWPNPAGLLLLRHSGRPSGTAAATAAVHLLRADAEQGRVLSHPISHNYALLFLFAPAAETAATTWLWSHREVRLWGTRGRGGRGTRRLSTGQL